MVTLTAEPDGGWQFVAWSGDLTVANNPVQLTMDGDKVVTATFTTTPPPSYTLTVNVVGSGSVAKSPDYASYISSTVVQLAAEPDIGWRFSAWSGDLNSVANPDVITMDADKTVTVTFTPLPTYTLTVNVVGNGSVTKLPSQTSYIESSLVQLHAAPSAGWAFTAWSGDLSGAVNPESLLMDGDKVVTTTFDLENVCEDVTDVTLTLLTTGDIYTDTAVEFRVTISPTTAVPYTYTIDFGEVPGAPVSTLDNPFSFDYTFPTTGTKTVTFAAWNCAMTLPVTDTVTFEVIPRPGPVDFFIFLPLVLRNYQ